MLMADNHCWEYPILHEFFGSRFQHCVDWRQMLRALCLSRGLFSIDGQAIIK